MEAYKAYQDRPWLKLYLEGVPAEIQVPEISVPQLLDEAMEKWTRRTALVFYGAKISYAQLKDHVDRFATALTDLGVSKGDLVALLLLNSPQFVIAYFGALKAGATVTPISPVYVSSEIRHQIEDSGAKTVICQDVLYNHLDRAELEPDLVIMTGVTDYMSWLRKFFGKTIVRSAYRQLQPLPRDLFERNGYYRFQDLIGKYPPKPPRIPFDPKEDLASLPYTGGTTGLPKGAMLSHYNLVAGASITRAVFSPIYEEGKEVVLAFLPFYHIYGQVVVMLSELMRGNTLVILTTPNPDHILNSIERYRATVFYGVPALYESLRDDVKTSRVNWRRLKILVSGADALLQDTAAGWENRTGVKIHEGYGMTETSSVSHISPYGKPIRGSFGVPMPDTLAAVMDPDSREFLPVGEVGELVISGPQVMKGYWNQPEETEKVLTNINGRTWLRTSDLARMDENGYFYFYDRKRDLIKYKGYAVFAREVEEVLFSHPQIKEAGVIGMPDPKVGENIKAVVVLQPEARGKISEQDIIDYCRDRLAHYKIPKIVEFRGEVPKTDVGKVSRRELREEI